jgi:hypothetical protein
VGAPTRAVNAYARRNSNLETESLSAPSSSRATSLCGLANCPISLNVSFITIPRRSRGNGGWALIDTVTGNEGDHRVGLPRLLQGVYDVRMLAAAGSSFPLYQQALDDLVVGQAGRTGRLPS